VKKLLASFDADWATTNAAADEAQEHGKDEKLDKGQQQETEKALASLVEELHPVTATVKKAVKKVTAQNGGRVLSSKLLKSTVKKVVKKAVKQAVKAAAREAKIK